MGGDLLEVAGHGEEEGRRDFEKRLGHGVGILGIVGHDVGQQRERDGRVAAHDVAEWQERHRAVLALGQHRIVAEHVGGGGDVSPVEEHGALRVGRRARRVHDRRGIVGPDARAQRGQRAGLRRQPRTPVRLESGERGDALVAIREERARVHDEDGLERRAVSAHGQRLVERLLVLGDHEAGAGVTKQVAQLGR